MRINEKTALLGPSVVLVPYRTEHVNKYHDWMQDPELLELTASEPLTLDEEFEMQQKWQIDNDKLTFIILSRENDHTARDWKAMSSLPMIGDVNMFFKDELEVECEVMIAEQSYRRKGLALEALRLILRYATSPSHSSPNIPLPVPPTSLVVRIGASNHPSISLFTRLGFSVSKRVEVFDEVEMKFAYDPAAGEHVEATQLVRGWTDSPMEEIHLE